jgi:hypothetical protein
VFADQVAYMLLLGLILFDLARMVRRYGEAGAG